jgi:hypothetical protein
MAVFSIANFPQNIFIDRLKSDRASMINREKLIVLGLKVFRRIQFKYLVVNAGDIKSFL